MPIDKQIQNRIYQRATSFIEENWYRPVGFLLIFFIAQILVLLFYPKIRGTLYFLDDKYGVILLSAVILLLITIFWFYYRRLPYFDEQEIGILFALPQPHQSKKTRDELEKLYRQTRLMASNLKFPKRLVIKKLSPNHTPLYDQDAHTIRDKSGAKLIIWGDAINGYFLKEEAVFIVPVKFSYHIMLSEEQTKNLNENFSALLRETPWIIRQSNDILDVLYLTQNIKIVTLYIIGLVLHFANQPNEAIELLREVFNALESKRIKKQITRHEKFAYERIRLVILLSYGVLIRRLNIRYSDKKNPNRISQAHNLIKVIKDIDKNSPLVYTFEAMLKFFEGDFDGAEEFIILAEKHGTYKDPTSSYGKAFLNFYRNRYDFGLTHLTAALDKERVVDPDILVGIAQFYEEVLEAEPDKKQLHYPLAIIYFEDLGDGILAKEHFEQFLFAFKAEESDPTMKKLLYTAKNYLRK